LLTQVVHTEFVGIFVVHLHTKFHMPVCSRSLVITIRPKLNIGFIHPPCVTVYKEKLLGSNVGIGAHLQTRTAWWSPKPIFLKNYALNWLPTATRKGQKNMVQDCGQCVDNTYLIYNRTSIIRMPTVRKINYPNIFPFAMNIPFLLHILRLQFRLSILVIVTVYFAIFRNYSMQMIVEWIFHSCFIFWGFSFDYRSWLSWQYISPFSAIIPCRW